ANLRESDNAGRVSHVDIRPPAAVKVEWIVHHPCAYAWSRAFGDAIDSAHLNRPVVECEHDLPQFYPPAVLPGASVEYDLLLVSQLVTRIPADDLARPAFGASRRTAEGRRQ